MLFKWTYIVSGYRLPKGDSIRIEAGGPHACVVVLRHEPAEGSAADVVTLEVTGDFDPPRKSAQALQDLAQGLLPVDSRPEPDLASEITERQLPNSGRGLSFDELPNRLCDYSSEVIRELRNTATQIFGLIRWRCAMEGPVEAFSSRLNSFQWRDASENWHVFPPNLGGRIEMVRLPRFSPEELSDLEALAISGTREPVAHALLREARRASGQREYASALVMGIAALEIGVKQLIGTLAPAAEWLVLHAPSPPVFEILRDYLPTIPAHESIGGNVARPHVDILETVRNGVNRRNEIVHRGKGELRQDFIAKVLVAVSDVLWMCDYFTGQKWALQNMSDVMRAVLPRSETVEPPDTV